MNPTLTPWARRMSDALQARAEFIESDIKTYLWDKGDPAECEVMENIIGDYMGLRRDGKWIVGDGTKPRYAMKIMGVIY